MIDEALRRLRAWGEAHNWKGYDPYDALNSPIAPALTLGKPLGRRLVTQAVKLSPLNLRPLLGIEPDWNAKAVGLVASGYARLWAATGDEAARRSAEHWLEWLRTHHSGDGSGLAWGYHFDVQTRFFFYPRGAPNTIATSFVAQAFLDGYELLGDERWLTNAQAAAAYLEQNMYDAGGYFRYLPNRNDLIHNANLLACAVLVRAGADSKERVARAVETSLRAQRDNGSWPYADGSVGTWVDNFHTAYVLEALALSRPAVPAVQEPLARGVDFWERELFLHDGRPKNDVEHVYPIDAHCYASAIDAWVAVGRLGRARTTAELLVERMLDPSGYVWFQEWRRWTNRVPFVRWTTAPTFRALAGLLLADRNDARLDRSR